MPTYLVPNIWATIPFVGGTVDNHKKPKVIPKITELITLGGKKIKIIIETPLNKYIELNMYFLLYLVAK